MKYMGGGKYEGTYVVDGILNLSEALKTSTVTSLRSPPPLTPPPKMRDPVVNTLRSSRLGYNDLEPQGGAALAQCLKDNSTLTALE